MLRDGGGGGVAQMRDENEHKNKKLSSRIDDARAEKPLMEVGCG
jgi:hypothetical protein